MLGSCFGSAEPLWPRGATNLDGKHSNFQLLKEDLGTELTRGGTAALVPSPCPQRFFDKDQSAERRKSNNFSPQVAGSVFGLLE